MPVIPVQDRRYEFFPVRRVYCVARNFADHAAQTGAAAGEKPFFFMKQPDMIVPVEDGRVWQMPLPDDTDAFEYEIELVACLGRGGRNLTREAAVDAVWGWCAGIDFTKRDRIRELSAAGRAWDLGKNFEGAAPVSHVRPMARTPLPAHTDLWLYVNNRKMQAGNTAQMIRDPFELISELSRHFTLAPGDLVFTGTPGGTGALSAGDRIEAGVNGVGSLKIELTAARA